MRIITSKAVSLQNLQDIFTDVELVSMSNITIPEFVIVDGEYLPIIELGENCFDFVPFHEIHISKTIKKIKWSFYSCKNLKNIYVDKENLYYTDLDGVLYDKDTTLLLAFPNSRKGTYYIPEGVKKINKFAFKTSNVEQLHIPKSVTEIGTNAFYQCKIKDIYFEGRDNIDDVSLGGFSSYDKKFCTNPSCHFGDVVIPLQEILS